MCAGEGGGAVGACFGARISRRLRRRKSQSRKQFQLRPCFSPPSSCSIVHTCKHNLALISSQHNGRPGGTEEEEEDDDDDDDDDASKTKQTWDELRVATRLV